MNAINQPFAPKRWLKMGVELEGAWTKRPQDVIKASGVLDAHAKRDGSVTVASSWEETEVITRPCDVLEELIKDVTALYPNAVDGSCGMHVHASFTVMDTSALADIAFYKHFKSRWEAWGKKHNPGALFWERYHGRTPARARGNQQYCRDIFKPEEQLTLQNDRYTQINFTAYHKLKTIECRMLPMFDATPEGRALAISAIVELSDIYNSFLESNNFPVIQMEREVVMGEGEDGSVTEMYTAQMPDQSYYEVETATEGPKVVVGPDVHYHYEAPGASEMMMPFGRVRDQVP